MNKAIVIIKEWYRYAIIALLPFVVVAALASSANKYEVVYKFDLKMPEQVRLVSIVNWQPKNYIHYTIKDPQRIEELYNQISTYRKIRTYDQPQIGQVVEYLLLAADFAEDTGNQPNKVNEGIVNSFRVYGNGLVIIPIFEDTGTRYIHTRIDKKFTKQLYLDFHLRQYKII